MIFDFENTRVQVDQSQVTVSQLGAHVYMLPNGSEPWLAVNANLSPHLSESKEFEKILSLLQKPLYSLPIRRPYLGSSGVVTKEPVTIGEQEYQVALKRIGLLMADKLNITGFEHFGFLMRMKLAGFETIEPVAATRTRMLSYWYYGERAARNDVIFQRFIRNLQEFKLSLEDLKVLRKGLTVDKHPSNYFYNPNASIYTPIERRFIAMDPLVKALW